MINTHLRWWEGSSDNLVSWTTSLLFALVYIFHLRANIRDSSIFADIQLCVLDTSSFPQGVFLRDMDLIGAYKRYNSQLTELGLLRLKQHRRLPGFYYFGEYLSQGVLKIEGKCQIVSAQAMIDRGLYTILPQLEDFAQWEVQAKPPWASAVIELRHELYANVSERQRTSCDGLKAVINISELFGRGWRMPMAINILALSPHRSDDVNIPPLLRTFTETRLLTVEDENGGMRIVAGGFTDDAEASLRCAIIFQMSEHLAADDLQPLDHDNTTP
ncbi:hypothetical protein CcaCcLH18_14206 [Colletotrichum camelliae]|nr:hypothetical protein CcaCcLH18_14206 [Colletotrichum camelliae]